VRHALTAFAVLASVSLVGWFAYHNTEQIPVIDLVFTTATEVPVWMALFSSALFGAAIALVVLAWPLFRLRMRVRRQERSIDEFEQEIHGLRTLPLSGEAAPEQKLQEG
jgi:uncharacterized integral membrane protein